MNKPYININSKITLIEKVLLLFIKPTYTKDKYNNIVSTIKCKKMFGKIYVLGENIELEKGENK